MTKLFIERTENITAPLNQVFSKVNDFHEWPKWSPWLIMEPDVKLEIADDGKSYSWEGDRVGSGNMKILEEKENEFIRCELNFLKPWKSSSTTEFRFSHKDANTQVSWNMDGSLPFFMFWMKTSMEAYVGADYERGLAMLKEYAESGELHTKLEFPGTVTFEGLNWIGIETRCSLDVIAAQMEADFGMLRAYGEKHTEHTTGEMLTIYKKWDLVKNQVHYIAAMGVIETPEGLPESFTSGSIPATRATRVNHIGAYRHVGNAWSTGYAMMRNKEFKYNKKVDAFEIYRNNPAVTPEKELLTELHFPCK